jgi:hypothetical protein
MAMETGSCIVIGKYEDISMTVKINGHGFMVDLMIPPP